MKIWASLRRDFKYRCAYCTCSEVELGGHEAFEADHFRPHSRTEFADLKFSYENIVYACGPCNTHKKAKWPDPETSDNRYINPCVEALYPTHLQITPLHAMEHVTKPGEFMYEALRFAPRTESLRRTFQRRAVWVAFEAAEASRDPKDIKRALDAVAEIESSLDAS